MAVLHIRIREVRKALGLTQAELAARSGVRRETISRIERSRVTSIDMMVLEKLATALGVEPGILIVRTAPPVGHKKAGRR